MSNKKNNQKKAVVTSVKNEEIVNNETVLEINSEAVTETVDEETGHTGDVSTDLPTNQTGDENDSSDDNADVPPVPETETKVERINIRDCEVGDVIRYASSKKPYIVAEKNLEAKRPYLFLYSKTQQYNSYKAEFEVIRLSKGAGILPEKFENEKIDFLPEVITTLAQRLESAKKRAEKEEAAKQEALAIKAQLETAKTETAPEIKTEIEETVE